MSRWSRRDLVESLSWVVRPWFVLKQWMKSGVDGAERARNHVLSDVDEEVVRDQTIHVLLGQIKDFVLWRLKLVKDAIRFSVFKDLSACCEQNGL